jgi:hypothetical protein
MGRAEARPSVLKRRTARYEGASRDSHPERSEAQSKDPVALSSAGPSTALGMTNYVESETIGAVSGVQGFLPSD